MIPSTEVLWRLKCALKRAGNAPISTFSLVNAERRPYGFKYITWYVGHNKSDVEGIIGKLFTMSLGNYIADVKVPVFVPGKRCCIDFILVESDDGKTNIDESVIEAIGKLKWKNNNNAALDDNILAGISLP